MLLDFIPRIPPRAFKNEAEFQSWIGAHIKDHHGLGWPYHKMSDASSDKKPCDCFYIDEDGCTYFMELKMIDTYTINLKKFEYQQVEFLSRVSSLEPVSGFHEFYSRALALVYSKKLQRWDVFQWKQIEETLMQHGSVQLFEKA